MNLTLSLLLVIFSALYIHVNFADMIPKSVHIGPRPDMLVSTAKKTKNGWLCGGVVCPKERTASCKTTNIIKSTAKLEHDLLVACMDADTKVFCGITRSSRITEDEVIELDFDGNMIYGVKESITTTEGKSIPRCQQKKKP